MSQEMNSDVLVSVRNLVKRFPIHGGILSREVASVKAVSGVSFDIKKGETLGLVGESGCGKSTLGRCILRLIEPSQGEIRFAGQTITGRSEAQLRDFRRSAQIIFQNPDSSLNPRMTVGEILARPLELFGLA